MIVLEAGQTIQAIAGTGTAITATIMGMELASSVEAYTVLYQGQLPTSAGTLYTVPAATQTFVKSLVLANATGSAVSGIKLFIGGNAATNQFTGSLTIPANGWAVMEENGWAVYDSNGARKQRSN